MNTPKSIFKSKAAFAGALSTLVGAAGTFIPDIGQILSNHAPAILFWAGLVHVAIRFITKGRVVLFAE